jgi:NAD+ synthase (glutamine-hydrolysing)
MRLIKVGAAVLNQTPLAWDLNRDNILSAIGKARNDGVAILCLPEMAIPGYGCQDAFQSPSVQNASLDVLIDEILPATQGLVVCVGLPLLYRNSLFNAVCLIADGAIVGFVCKRYLAGDGVHYEPRWFKPWKRGFRSEVEVRGKRYPIGDLFFDVGGIKVGFEICEDAWVASRPGSDMAGRGVDIILNPSASHFAFNKLEVRKRFVIEGSRAFGVTYVYANLLGNDAGRIVYDGGAMIARSGSLIALGRRFGYHDVEVTSAVVDVELTRMKQSWTSSFRPRLEVSPGECARIDFAWPEVAVEPDASTQSEPWETSPHRREEEFTRAICLSLFDYMRRSRSRGFVISLSGGADSTACACLVAIMCRQVIDELGLDGFKERLAYFARLAPATSVEEVIHTVLLCAYQGTRNSSTTTRDAARSVAEGINAEFLDLDVDGFVERYTSLIEQAIGRELTWADDDLTLQNIQARVRGPSVWMLANLRGALLVSTSNRSEAAVGYATMDGDTCGGISPIGGIDKAFLRSWLRWLEATGPEGHGPIAAVRAVNVQQPTAELRPREQTQTDEADLMPYPLLDAIEEAAIRDKHDPLETFKVMRVRYADIEPRQLAVWVERFFVLWCRNQWKRERYAPSFHVDDTNLDPKTWCRFPILSSGYARELAALRAYVNMLDS